MRNVRTSPCFVGEMNPYGLDPRYALFDLPERSAGGRLCRKILGLPPHTYREFPRVNLCGGKWSNATARQSVEMLLHPRRVDIPDVFVLLGRKVAAAFHDKNQRPLSDLQFFQSRDFQIGSGSFVTDVVFISLPHPSGRCLIWNDPDAVRRARDLLTLHCPDVPWGCC